MGVTGLALGSLLGRDRIGRAGEVHGEWRPADGLPHFVPRAKSVIWIFLSGGYSHLETFDPKPALNRLAGKTYDETGLDNPQRLPLFLERSRSVVGFDRELYSRIMPLQVGYHRHGASGIEVGDWLPHLAGCVDDLTVVRSMYTTERPNSRCTTADMPSTNHSLPWGRGSITAWAR
jgi:hypothetical protein